MPIEMNQQWAEQVMKDIRMLSADVVALRVACRFLVEENPDGLRRFAKVAQATEEVTMALPITEEQRERMKFTLQQLVASDPRTSLDKGSA